MEKTLAERGNLFSGLVTDKVSGDLERLDGPSDRCLSPPRHRSVRPPVDPMSTGIIRSSVHPSVRESICPLVSPSSCSFTIPSFSL